MNPMSSRGHPSQIRRYRALHPGQLSARSSRRCVFAHGQLSAVSSRGLSSRIRRYRALHPGQLPARSSRGPVLAPDQHSVGSSRGCVFAHGQLSAVSSRGLSSQIRRYRALQHGQLSAVSSRGLALAPDQPSVGLSCGLVPSVLYSPSLCIRSCNSCTVTLTACPCTKPDRPSAILCNVSLVSRFVWYSFCPTKNHTGYESRTACGPTRWIRPPAICLHRRGRRRGSLRTVIGVPTDRSYHSPTRRRPRCHRQSWTYPT